MTIASGGQLFINNASLPNSGGVNTANSPKENSFEVYTSSCGSRVQVTNGGSLTLGQPNDTHYASLRITRSSLLDLQSGGQATVNAGSVLRIGAGGTLVVRQGSTLTLNGQLVLEAGAYLCVENAASIVKGSGGQLTVATGSFRYANPALGLTGLSCQPNYPPPPCTSTGPSTVSLTANYPDPKGECMTTVTVTAEGQGLSSNYRWTVDGVAQTDYDGLADIEIYLSKTTKATRRVNVQVDGCDGAVHTATRQVSYSFAGCTSRVAMYPNPAADEVNFSSEGDEQAGGPQARASSAAPAEYTVRVYDGQGALRWQGSSSGGQLRLASGEWPRGLYGVVITLDSGAISRLNLSLE